ncbi:MAG: FliM/FliN family flagellar motor switch protein [Phycisphaerae bacterium]|jgi:flagellar motor switch protein FliM
MTEKPRNQITLDKIRQLMNYIGVPKDPAEKIEATDYDWTVPHCFNSAELEKLNEFAGIIAPALTSRFDKFLQSSFEVSVSQITQHYAEKYISSIIEAQNKDYYLILKGEKDSSCGLVIVPNDTAAYWLKILLGESETTQKEISQLENFLLGDLISQLADAVIISDRRLNLTAAKTLLSENFSLDIAGSEELCKITFDIMQNGSDQHCQMHIVLPCSKLQPIVTAISNKKKLTPEQVKNMILEHAKQLPVGITARFAEAELKFEQILTLQKGDVLMLDKKITEPVELIVEGRTRYLAHTAKCDGRLAVRITHANTKEN